MCREGRPMGEGCIGGLVTKCTDGGTVRDASKCDDDLQTLKFVYRARQKLAALVDFTGYRLVFRRDAPHGVGDSGTMQFCSETQISSHMPGREAEFLQSCIE